MTTRIQVAPAFYDEQASRLFARSPLSRMRRICSSKSCEDAPGSVSDADLVERLQDAEAVITQMQALAADDLRELRRRRVVGQNEAGLSGPESDEDGWVVCEIGVALALSDRQVHERLASARSLARYDLVGLAMSLGSVQSWTAQRLVSLLDELARYVSPERLRRVEAEMVRWLLSGPRTVTRLNARMRRLITKARADAGQDADDDVHQRQAQRRVSVTCERDGTATVFARLPEADGLAIARALDQQARDPVDEQDDRTIAQRQADLLVAAVTGAPAVWGLDGDLPDGARATRGVTTRLSVAIPVQSLVGNGAPADVPGFGPIPASTARQLAGSDQVEARPIVYDGASGRLLGIGAYLPASRWWADGASPITWGRDIAPVTGYQHPRLMDEFVRTRDRFCRAPGCRRPAARCDCDHLEPYPSGSTSVDNGCCLCRRHHRLKTHAPGWKVTGAPDTYLTWVTPTGATARTMPHDHRTDDERERDVPPF